MSTPAVDREAVRVILIDPAGRTCLFRSSTRTGDSLWFTPGGGIDEGEHLLDAAVREVYEETGYRVNPEDLEGPHAERTFTVTRAGVDLTQHEVYYTVHVPHFDHDRSRWLPDEVEAITAVRWWSVSELRATHDIISPPLLSDLLDAHRRH